MIEWKTYGPGICRATAGMITLSVTMTIREAEWGIYVDGNHAGDERRAARERFTGTLDEAKARAVELATALVAPLVAEAVAAERAATRAEIERQRDTDSCAELGHVIRASALLAWLDARSKDGAR
jgi:hypothetical protein